MTPIEWILEAACIATGVTMREMRGPNRTRPMVARRRFVVRKMRAEGYSLPKIGRALGGRDHTTILHYLRTA